MPSLPQYLLELTLGLGLFYAGYRWAWRHTPALARRGYLLGTPLLALLLPLLHFGAAPTAPVDPALVEQLYRGTYKPETLPPFVLQLGDLALYAYFVGLVVAAFRLLDRWWKIYRQLQRRAARRNAHYALVDGNEAAVPFSLLPHIYWNQRHLSNRWRYLWTHERSTLRVYHALDALWLDVLVVLLWFHPLIYLFRRRARALHAARATTYARAKLEGLRQYLGSLTPGHRFVPVESPPTEPTPPRYGLGNWFQVWTTFGLTTLLLLLLFGFDLSGHLPGGQRLAGAGQRLTALGHIELYRYAQPDNYEFYWGRKLAVILAPLPAGARSPIPVGPSAELTLADLQRAVADEPLLSLQYGPLFNRIEFNLSLERGYEVLFDCTIVADSGDPDAYPNNACLSELLQLVRPGDLLVFNRMRHHFRKIETHPPNFSLRIREAPFYRTGDPFTPTAYRLNWGVRSVPCFQTPFNYLLCEPQYLSRPALDTLMREAPVIDTAGVLLPLDQLVFHLKQQDSLIGYAYGRSLHPDALPVELLNTTTHMELFGRIELDGHTRQSPRFQAFRARFRVGPSPPYPLAHFDLDGPVLYAPVLDQLFYFPAKTVHHLVGQRLLFFDTQNAPRPLRRLSVENMITLQRVHIPDATGPYPPEWDSLIGATTSGDLLHLTGTFTDGENLDFWWAVR